MVERKQDVTKGWVAQWDVASRTHPEQPPYKVSVRPNGTWACSCAKWKFAKAPKPDCHHIKEVKVKEPLATAFAGTIAMAKGAGVHTPTVQSKPVLGRPEVTANAPTDVKATFAGLQTTRLIILED